VNAAHHTAIIVGGGPAGLALAVVLGGWHPYYRGSGMFSQRYPQLAQYLAPHKSTLLGLDFRALVNAGVAPADLFRLLHHPRQKFEELAQVAMEFRQGEPLDYLLISQEPVGGLWNRAPRNLLTLSPGQWMEFAFYPLAQYAEEAGLDFDVNELICKTDLIEYYHQVPARFGLEERLRIGEKVVRIEPNERGFLLTSAELATGTTRQYTCQYLVYAAGQRCSLRRLGVEGEELPFVSNQYDHPLDYPGHRVLVVGGGRSADWAATELHDAGRQVWYSMRQSRDLHWQLIGDSRHGLPYYARLAQILESKSPRLEALYRTRIRRIGRDGRVWLNAEGEERVVQVDHLVKEIGGIADYSLFTGFPAKLQLEEKYDNYRFQVHQVRTHPHNYESVDIPNLYVGGYLAAGIGLVVIAMHGTTYAIAGDILQKEGRL
jgi:thioredoxin reductase